MKVEISKKNKMIVITILAIVLLINCFFTYKQASRAEYKEDQKVVLEYTIVSKEESKIFLKNNDIYSTPYLSDDVLLISDLINNIESTFNMEIKSDTADSIKADIDTSVVLQSYFGDKDDILWTKVKKLSDKVVSGEKYITCTLTNTYNIDEFKVFMLNAFKQTDLKTKTVLSVVWDIKGEAVKNETKLPVNKTYKINMQISDSVFKIEKVDIKDSSENATVKEDIKVNKNLKLICLFIIIDFIIIGFMIFIKKAKVKKEKSNYQKKKDQIFKDYSDRLAKLEQSLQNQYANIINMKDIVDLVRISDEIRQPIFYYEVDEEDEKKIEYFVFDEGRIYYLVYFDKIDDTITDFINKNN